MKILFNIKCSEFNIAHYDKWKEYIAGIDTMKTVTKNDKLKVLKAFLKKASQNAYSYVSEEYCWENVTKRALTEYKGVCYEKDSRI